MPRKRELTWHEPRKCWKKKRDGRQYYLGKGRCTSKSDEEGYRAALDEWKDIQRQLDQQRDERRAREESAQIVTEQQRLLAVAERARLLATSNERALQTMRMQYPVAAMGGTLPVASNTLRYPTESNIERMEEVCLAVNAIGDMLEEEASHLGRLGLGALIDRFIEVQDQRARSRQIAASTAEQYRTSMTALRRWCEQEQYTDTTQLTAEVFSRYRSAQLREIELNVAPRTVRDRLLKAKQFAEWLYMEQHIDMIPRTLVKGYTKVKMARPVPKHWEVEELREIWAHADARTRLYMALALNCGYTLVDLGTLEKSHIDFGQGIIRRMRHKTDVPQQHRLWLETIDLLRKNLNPRNDALALRSPKGAALWMELGYQKHVKHCWESAVKAAQVEESGRQFRHLRSTGAALIERGFPGNPELSSQYLAHSVKETKRFYTDQNLEKMWEALDWMRGELGFADQSHAHRE